MLPIYLRNQRMTAVFCFWMLMGLALFAMPAYSQQPNVTDLSAQTILVNIAESIPNLMRLVTAIAYVMGMLMIIRGVVKLKHVGEARTQMSHEHHLTGPIVQIAIGVMLLYIPTSVRVGMSTFWTNPNPYGYLQQEDQWSQFINVCYLIVQFVGVVAFIRGLLMLSHLGGHGGQQNTSRGITHIIGGILCINIYQFVQVILATVGISS
ncbi:MAG: hypothetical protein KIT56_01575 [Gammaproteobacteria bacterium]|nr:hypothetical protein [Gammaproteobacteria bacterium]MCW5582573.1 hypothetical protein [Gammaproteobacteria bacterium]